MLKEFRGHSSYVNCCAYVTIPYSVVGIGEDDNHDNQSSRLTGNSVLLVVVTASADGSV